MANFIMDFLSKVTGASTTTQAADDKKESVPPLYEPKSSIIRRYNDHSVGYEKMGPCNGVKLQLPNGETLNYISRNTKNDGKLL